MRKVFIFNKGYDVRATVEVEYTTEGEEKRLSICGTLYAPNIRCGGQCLDHIAQYIDDEKFKTIYFVSDEGRNFDDYKWLRSPYYGSSYSFCCVTNLGYSSYNSANYSRGVAFGFCL